MQPLEIEQIAWHKGLIPAIIQDANTGKVLMLAYMNQPALLQTLETNKVTFFSRSRNCLWTKGETSGHYLKVTSIALDCDNDSILITAYPAGPTCHTGADSCFKQTQLAPWQILTELETVITQRYHQRPENSYTTQLFDAGLARVAQKVGEEAVESVIASLTAEQSELCQEISDLMYHLLVLMRLREISIAQVYEVLLARHAG